MIVRRMAFAQLIFLMYTVLRLTTNASLFKNSYPADVIEDAELDTYQLIAKHKYPAETHFITTEDKYIVRVHRISNPGGKPILLMHGLLDSSATYVLMGPTHSLAYYLFEQGYDVWLGNARGNRYSRNHTDLDPDNDDVFWNFSWHEIGIYDVPAMVDYILEVTNSTKLFYIGHSQGATAFFVLCSMRPEYNEKFILGHALAPAVFMEHIRSPLLVYGQSYLKMPSIRSKLEYMPNSKKFEDKCLSSKVMQDTCIRMLFMIMGEDMPQFNKTTLPKVLKHIPAGAAVKQLLHYNQLISSHRFCQYDYDQDNKNAYGQSSPPDYELDRVTAPVALQYGVNDYLSDARDVLHLSEKLPNVVDVHKVDLKQCNHMDFVYAVDARKLIYQHIEELNERYTST